MSIQKEYGEHILECDCCNIPERIVFDKWDDVIQFKKENGWHTKKEGHGKIDICPDCWGGVT